MTLAVSVGAPAKVNLRLRVLHRREDGYHEIETLLQAISLEDEVVVELTGNTVELVVTGARLGPPEENLAFRAATSFRETFGVESGVRVHLTKNIPAGAGLGGGSSDAAAVLRCLGALTGVGDPSSLHRLACDLGSDVPFFLGESPYAVAGGRGERLRWLPALPQAHLVLVMPPIHVSTAEAYRALDRPSTGRGGAKTAADTAPPRSWEEVVSVMLNDFQDPIAAAHEPVAESLRALVDQSPMAALLSGSGAASFGLFGSRADAERARSAVSGQLGYRCLAVDTLERQSMLRSVG